MVRVPVATANLLVAFALVISGCVGTLASDFGHSQSGPNGASDAGASSVNLTLKVVDWSARWVLEPIEEPTRPDAVKVNATVRGMLTINGEPASEREIGGIVNFTIWSPCWGGCSSMGQPNERKEVYEVWTGPNGGFQTEVGPVEYDPGFVPVVYDLCERTQIWAWGTQGWNNDSAPRDSDSVITTVCTQSYP